MNEKKSLRLRGPVALALGGAIIVFPFLGFVQLLYEGRLSFPYEGAATGMMLYVTVLTFFGLLIAGMGLQMIFEDSK